MRKIYQVCWGLVGILLSAALPAAAGEWRSVMEMSSLVYTATYEGEPVEGKFEKFDVTLLTNKNTGIPESLIVNVYLASANMGGDDINEAIWSEPWFDIKKFPAAVFKASSIQQNRVDKKEGIYYLAQGTLILKGTEKKIAVPFLWKRDRTPSSLSGQLKMNRHDFGIGSGEWATGDQIGLEVNVAFSVSLNEHP